MKRFAALALAAVATLLSGCATYDDYAYHDDDRYYDDAYYDDGYYDDRRYSGDRYYNDRAAYSLSYGSAAYRYPAWGGYGYGYGPDYLVYNSYYSALWPTYRYYYDPFWSPGFYYGVTYFPRTYFGLNLGWYSWPYYQAYSPYRYSHTDHYYDWWSHNRDHSGYAQRHGGYLPRYGSARNEAQAMARRSGVTGAANAYYGASSQPGAIVDPGFARQARGRGQALPFEQAQRDWNIEPYGRDGRGYRGFAEGATPGVGNPRSEIQRGGRSDARSVQPYDPSQPDTRSTRGYSRDPRQTMPSDQNQGRGDSFRRAPIRDERAFEPTTDRYDRSDRSERSRRPIDADTNTRTILPRQTRDPHNPVFERHYNADPESREVRQYEPRSRSLYRGQPSESREVYQQDMTRGRSYARPQSSEPGYQRQAPSFERSQSRYQRQTPTVERSEPRYERPAPSFERQAPTYERAQPSYQRSEPRSAPSYQRSEPSYTPAPARSDSGRSDSGRSSSSSSSGSSSRGQLDRIIRDDD